MTIKPDGKFKKITRWQTVLLDKKDEVIINLSGNKKSSQQTNETEIVLMKSFVLRFKRKTLILKRGGKLIKMAKVAANDNGRMVITIR